MRAAKSFGSLLGHGQQSKHDRSTANGQLPPPTQAAPPPPQPSTLSTSTSSGPTSPICRCRVMYLGSSVPHITKDGLQGIQEPLRELYPDKNTLSSGNAGIDSWLSVWSNGILIENVDENGREVKRFFKIDALHYCAAVKYVSLPPSAQPQQYNPYTTLPNGAVAAAGLTKFLPLDSPYARQVNSHPPVFACILRRTTGIKVLECHAFICKREAAANALVRCCFHAYADTMYAKQIGADLNNLNNDINNNSVSKCPSPQFNDPNQNHIKNHNNNNNNNINGKRSKSFAALNNNNGDPNLWSNQEQNLQNYERQAHNSSPRAKSLRDDQSTTCDTDYATDHQSNSEAAKQMRKQQKMLSKSMHHLNLNQNSIPYAQNTGDYDQSTSASCINAPNGRWRPDQPNTQIQDTQLPPQAFMNPYASRVPSYPPPDLMANVNNGGTLRSIKSMAANSIASTLMRSKKHAKAMSIAQLNQDKVMSFHQPNSSAATMSGPLMLPPVPHMFLTGQNGRPIFNGSQTMKAPSRSAAPLLRPINFESMTPKEMKKFLKNSAKYGIDPSRFGENGLSLLPLRQPMLPNPHTLAQLPNPQFNGMLAPQFPPPDIYGANIGAPPGDVPDIGLPAHAQGMSPLPPLPDHMKPILVKPTPEFLKSKAGRKWLKQQKEFKKLLPPHLDGLPIVFGPPPPDAIEPAGPQTNGLQPPPTFLPPPIPVMDSAGFYNPNAMFDPSRGPSAASTMLRQSPRSQIMHHDHKALSSMMRENDYALRNQPLYGNGVPNGINNPYLQRMPRDTYINDNASMISATQSNIDMQRQYLDQSLRHGNSRNRMVEQSVISLGDENDYDEEDTDNTINTNTDYGQDYNQNNTSNGGFNNVNGNMHNNHRRNPNMMQSSSSRHHNNHASNNMTSDQEDAGCYSQAGYEQVLQASDDQSSYSSGIYKRGHMNERAFSYSLQQQQQGRI